MIALFKIVPRQWIGYFIPLFQRDAFTRPVRAAQKCAVEPETAAKKNYFAGKVNPLKSRLIR